MDKKPEEVSLKKCRGYETVITMCCEAGKKSIEGILPDKRIIAGMNAKGIVNAVMKSTLGFVKLSIDKSMVNVSRFTFNS